MIIKKTEKSIWVTGGICINVGDEQNYYELKLKSILLMFLLFLTLETFAIQGSVLCNICQKQEKTVYNTEWL